MHRLISFVSGLFAVLFLSSVAPGGIATNPVSSLSSSSWPSAAEAAVGEPAAVDSVEDSDSAETGGRYVKTVLDRSLTYPMELEVAPDGRVFYIERTGALKVWDPAAGRTYQAGYVPTRDLIEDGLLGIELDPDFASNGWIYLYYTPRSGAPNRLSRFTLREGRLAMESEVVMLEVPVQREKCCHSAGSLEFGPDGTLFLSTGDNTSSPDSIPNSIDERPGHYLSDAQRSSANTNDLRGKILRIRPLPDGSYEIPEGNLFPDTPATRPEIYTMGHRNPWRISVDPKNGWLYWGDVGPPGGTGREGYAPPAYDEFNLAREPGFFGWPYFTGPNAGYRDRDLATGEWGAMPDPEAPINDSPFNTGRRELPPADSAWIWYSYGPSERFPEMGAGGMSAAAGPTYYHPGEAAHAHALPDSLSGRVFIYEWARSWIKTVETGPKGEIRAIRPFAPTVDFDRPADLTIGPEGRLFLLEWGSRFWGSTRDARLVRIDFHAGGSTGERSHPAGSAADRSTRAASTSSADSGPASSRAAPFSVVGSPRASAAEGESAVRVRWPLEGGFFDYGRSLPFHLEAAPNEVVHLRTDLAHNTHHHPGTWSERETDPGGDLAGSVRIEPDTTHGPYILDRHARFLARERTGSIARIRLTPRVLEAEHAPDVRGADLVVTENRQDPLFAYKTEVFTELETPAYLGFEPVHLHGIEGFTLRYRTRDTVRVQLRSRRPTGPPIGSAVLRPDTTRPDSLWIERFVAVRDPGGTHALFLTAEPGSPGYGERDARLELDFMRARGPGMHALPEETGRP